MGMSCYPCTHCNKCGMFSARAVIVCKNCGNKIPVGKNACPECGCTEFETRKIN